MSQFVYYTPYGEAIVDEHLTTYENPFKFSGKELDDITGLYDHGARSRNPISMLWYGIDPLFEKYPDFSPYNYCEGNPIKMVDLDGKQTCLVVETKGTGHTFIYVCSGNKAVVYTYGRYLNDGVFTGQDFLLKLDGAACKEYMKDELYRIEANAYLITDADDSKVCAFFDNQYNASTIKPNLEKYTYNIRTCGKVIDEYNLFGNNCTTKSCNAVKFAGSKIFDDKVILGFDEDFVIPSSLNSFLQDNATNCTSNLKNQLKDIPQRSVLKSAGPSSESSGCSGSSIGSSSNSSFFDSSSSGNGSELVLHQVSRLIIIR